MQKPNRIKIGVAGTDGLGYEQALKEFSRAGLQAMEVEFTYGVRMSEVSAREVGALAKSLGIALSVHAPYYINLASKEKEKIAASRKRILESAHKAHLLGATHVVFHAGFYQERGEDEVYKIIRSEIIRLMKALKNNNWKTALALETTGRKTQFGSLEELLRLRKEIGCEICVDFAHLLAREGKVDYNEIFKKLKGAKHIHAHFSGIEFTAKGEKKHLLTKEKDIAALLKHIIKRRMDVTIINESPQPLRDAIKTKKIFDSLTKRAPC